MTMSKRVHAVKTTPDDFRGQMTEAQLQTIDRAVGRQVRFRRISLGLSQQAVSGIMGLTFQQLQKYEHGTNRISGSRLYQLGQILHVPVSFFFENVEADLGITEKVPGSPDQELPPSVMNKKKTIDLVKAFYSIKNTSEREAAFKLIATLGAAAKAEG